MFVDIIDRLREEIANRVTMLEQQKGKHAEDIEKFQKEIEKAKEKESKLEQNLKEVKAELAKLNNYLNWKTD